MGVYGELLVGYKTYGHGYLNQSESESTKEGFLVNPWRMAKEKPGVLYRTGDLVRWRDTGELELEMYANANPDVP